MSLFPTFEENYIDKIVQLRFDEIKNTYGNIEYFDWHKTRKDIEYGYKAAQSNKLFSVENMKKAIEMARILFEENLFDVEDILGLTEVETSNMSLKYSEDEIIKSLSTQQL